MPYDLNTNCCSLFRNGNGKIESDEFFDFIKSLGLSIPRSESDLIFNSIDIDENKVLCFEEFYQYFVNSVVGDTGGSKSEAKLRAAFLAADRDGSGTVSFREFAEYAWERKRDFALNDLLGAFERLDVDQSGEISYNEFRKFFGEETKRTSVIALGGVMLPDSADAKGPAIEDMFKGFYDKSDAQEVGVFM